MDWRSYLESIYYDPKHPGSFSSVDKLYRAVKDEGKFKIGRYRIRKWLNGQETHGVHGEVRRKFKRNRVVVGGIDEQWDGDTMDMSSFAKANAGFRYILLLIDIFSKYIWVQPLKTKKGNEMVSALKVVFSQGRKPEVLRTDKGSEFVNRWVNKYLNSENVHHFVTYNEPKAHFSERAIKTIKKRIFRFFTYNQTHRYVDILQDIVSSYNKTYHRSVKMAPGEVTKDTESQVWVEQYLPMKRSPVVKKELKVEVKKEHPVKSKKKSPFKYKIGDTVRLSYMRNMFDRAYDEHWSGEVFKVSKRFLRADIPIYKLQDMENEDIKGSFYEAEMQRAFVAEDHVYKIEKIMKTRTRNRTKEHLVRWMYWPPKFDTWVKDSELKYFDDMNKR